MTDNQQQNDKPLYGSAEVIFPHPAVVDFPHVFSVDPSNGKYACTFLFDKDTEEGKETIRANMQAIFNAVKRGFVKGAFSVPGIDPTDTKTFDDKVKEFMRLKDFHNPIHDGAAKAEKNPEFTNRWYVKATSKPSDEHPSVPAVDMERTPLTSATLYSGALAKAKIWYAPYSNNNGFGVTAILSAIVKTGDGERLAGFAPSDPLDGFGLPDDEPKSDDPFEGIV